MKQIILGIAIPLFPTTALPRTFGAVASNACEPTEEDAMGPFYKPDAPVSSNVGQGYVLHGVVRSSKECAPLPGAAIELWRTGPECRYDDAQRATIIANSAGVYHFESNAPRPIEGRPPHIHLRVSANGFNTLVTQHYPSPGNTDAVFDIVPVHSP